MSIELRNKIAELERRVEALEKRTPTPSVDLDRYQELMRDHQAGKRETLTLPEKRQPNG